MFGRPSFPPVRQTKASAARAAFISDAMKESAPAILELPEEVLCRILAALPFVYDVLACGQVCRTWSEALRSDVLWQGLYSQTWGPEETERATDSVLAAAEAFRIAANITENSGASKSPKVQAQSEEAGSSQNGIGQDKIKTPSKGKRPVSTAKLTKGLERLTLSPRKAEGAEKPKVPLEPCVWRDAFAARFKAEKKQFLTKEIKVASDLALLKRRLSQATGGGRAFDPAPGMSRLVERLQIRFEMRINNGKAIPLGGRRAYQSFPTSLSLKCPPSVLGQGLTVQKLLKIEVTAVSEKLYSSTRLITVDPSSIRSSSLITKGDPLSLYEASLYPSSPAEGGSLVVGTFSNAPKTQRRLSEVSDRSQASLWEPGPASTSGQTPEKDGEVVLLVLNIPYVDLLWKVMALGQGSGPRELHRPYMHDFDSQYGLHDYHASVQIRSFGKLLWCQDFYRCFHSKRESVPGEKAVFVFLPNEGGMPALFQGTPKLAWRTEAFSGEETGACLLDFVLWDQNNEIAWHCSKLVSTKPSQSSSSAEFGLPFLEGQRLQSTILDSARGICLSLELQVPVKDPSRRAGEDILPQSAVTGLRLALTSDFLKGWFGVREPRI